MAKGTPNQITTLNEFIEWVEQLKKRVEQLNLGKCLFRGLSNEEYSIEASAWRRLKHEVDRNNPGMFFEINTGLINDARLYEHHLRNGRELKDLEILAELQHFRAATCLIDFTYSAQVALWFACQSCYRKAPNSEELADGKVGVVFDNTSKIKQITPDLLNEDISYFFETNEDGIYPLYQWQPRQLNNRIFPQYSVFLFGGDRIIEPDEECIIAAGSKKNILASLEDFSQTTEATLFPDFEGFVYQRTQERPYNVSDYKEHGYRAYQNRQYEEAITYFDEAINRNPNDMEAYKLRGDAKIHLGRYIEAIEDFDDAISRDPNMASAYYARGAANYFLYQNESAISDFDDAIRLNPDDRRSYKLRGDVKRDLGRFDEAKNDFQTALELASRVDDTFLIASITPALRDIDSRIAEDEHWTSERFGELVPEGLRNTYEVQNRDGELYSLGANLQALIQEQAWELTRRFGIKHIFFFAEDIRLFGINLFSSRPRLTFCGITEVEARCVVPQYEFTVYPQYSQLVCQRGPTVEDLRPLFEYVFMKCDSISALNRILEDYDYLEYDESNSKGIVKLSVKVKDAYLEAERNSAVIPYIKNELELATGRFYVPILNPVSGSPSEEVRDTKWRYFTLYEKPRSRGFA